MSPEPSSKDIGQTRKCHRIFSFSTYVILEIRSKCNYFFVMSQLYIHKNLVRVQLLLCRQESITRGPCQCKWDLLQKQYLLPCK